MRAASFFVLAGVLYFGGVVARGECLCGSGRSPKEALARADAVFTGRVESIEVIPDDQAERKYRWARTKVTFRLMQSWKGAPALHIDVYTGLGSNDCGYPFVRGSNYLVYADRMMGEGVSTTKLSTTLCDRTREYSKAREDLHALGAGHKPSAK